METSQQHDDNRFSDLAVLGANDYKQKRRLERILDAMDNIPDQADRAKEMYFDGEINHDARRVMVQDAVKDAIWEAWNLLVDHENACLRRSGEEESDDGVWPHSKYFIGHPDGEPLGIIAQQAADPVVIWGLRDFFQTDEMWSEKWVEKDKPRNCETRRIEREQLHTIPRSISWAAALLLKEFLNDEHDMEIKFEEMGSGPDAKFTVEDFDPTELPLEPHDQEVSDD